MDAREFAIARLDSFLAEVTRLNECEFPYEHSQAALHKIRDLFQAKLTRLEGFHAQSNQDVVKQECTLSLSALFNYVPLLGFILRSTNVRNSFEVFGPLLRLARDVLEHHVPVDQQQTRLVLSSEWDYSPFVYRDIPALPGFVLIGLPAPESSNPLLIPLAGHELGHSLWANLNLDSEFTPVVKQHILNVIKSRWKDFEQVFHSSTELKVDDLTSDMFCVQFWERAIPFALAQAEETFCDFVGTWIFGTSYLHAFAYMLSPSMQGTRSPYYPNLKIRVQNIELAATQYGIDTVDEFGALFQDQAEPTLIQSDEFILEVADEVAKLLVTELVAKVNVTLSESPCGRPCATEVDRIFARFRHVVPAEGCRRLSDILNAGWRAYHAEDIWREFPEVARRKGAVLKELVLKNAEVFEIEQILRQSA